MNSDDKTSAYSIVRKILLYPLGYPIIFAGTAIVMAFMTIKILGIPSLLIGFVLSWLFKLNFEQTCFWVFIALLPIGAVVLWRCMARDKKVIDSFKTTGTACCPKCGSAMLIRTARRGRHSGKKFLGCSKYPACKLIVNL